MPTVHAWIMHDENGESHVVTDDPRENADVTDWDHLESMTEEEIVRNALSDPDNPPSTPEQLARMRPTTNVRSIRHRLQLTQEEFAHRFGIALGTLRDWEQLRRKPDSTARTLLRLINMNPDLVAQAVESIQNADMGEESPTAVARATGTGFDSPAGDAAPTPRSTRGSTAAD